MSTVSCRRRRQQGPLFSVKRKRWPTKLMMFGRPKKKGGKEKIRRLNRVSRKSRPSTFWKISFPGKKRRSSTSFTLIYANKTGRCTNVYSSGVDVLNDSKASAKFNDQNRTQNTWRWMGRQLPRSTNLGQRRGDEEEAGASIV